MEIYCSFFYSFLLEILVNIVMLPRFPCEVSPSAAAAAGVVRRRRGGRAALPAGRDARRGGAQRRTLA